MKEIMPEDPKRKFLEDFRKSVEKKFEAFAWTDEQKQIVREETSRGKVRSLMFTSIPMECKAESCLFASTCPLQKQGIAPRGSACPIESGMVVNFMADYIDELGIDPENLTELSQVRDLVDQEVQYIRKSLLLAKEDFIQENVVGVDSDGDPVMRKELHLAIDYEDRILKRKAVLWKQMLATREAQAKIGLTQLDAASSMSNLMASMRDIQTKRENELKQRLGIVDQDDYIIDTGDEDE